MKTKLLAVDDNDIDLLVMALDKIRLDKKLILSHGTACDITKRLFDLKNIDKN